MAKSKKNSFTIEKGTVKPRNPYAVAARLHSGAGRHTDQRKERSRKACRGRITHED